jgi:general secretion pathway protein D
MRRFKIWVTILAFLTTFLTAHNCEDQLFTVTIKKEISIADAIDNIAENCGLSVVVKDVAAQRKLQSKLFYINLRNATLENFLDTVLKENNIHYKLVGNKLLISYLITKTFKVHYIASKERVEVVQI